MFKVLLNSIIHVVKNESKVTPTNTLKASLVPVCLTIPLYEPTIIKLISAIVAIMEVVCIGC